MILGREGSKRREESELLFFYFVKVGLEEYILNAFVERSQ